MTEVINPYKSIEMPLKPIELISSINLDHACFESTALHPEQWDHIQLLKPNKGIYNYDMIKCWDEDESYAIIYIGR